ncbi:uncharacterized protein ASCRUDRAFT_112617 [Ascoidea rubescens DSM 1968]|uniref:Uncharacterized protein n=1 Tax=Ascoidea rubescens DSM 1968 TaxID=1344418 RepID=A0A1D2VCT7_9ASCO|nr:hypothetical protein ASCRUDRAFT_112617 [Ascoidea rubescens DSM 1968]ODV59441.1 hypothetical protein ASCRUDRAFT_112617 [Ascoidea rubescens DSM 1968]
MKPEKNYRRPCKHFSQAKQTRNRNRRAKMAPGNLVICQSINIDFGSEKNRQCGLKHSCGCRITMLIQVQNTGDSRDWQGVGGRVSERSLRTQSLFATAHSAHSGGTLTVAESAVRRGPLPVRTLCVLRGDRVCSGIILVFLG